MQPNMTDRSLLKRVGAALIALIGLLVLIEVAVRLSGIADFPLYKVGGAIQYIVASNQSGRFLNRNDWYFNNKSMPIKRDWTVVHPNVLLIGNSIIMGGNPFRQAEKLSSQIQMRLGPSAVVWPAAIGGWAQPNEVAYLNAHPEIVGSTDYIAWEYMGGGLSAPTPWAGQYVFPDRRPLYATGYIFRRYVLPKLIRTRDPSELPVTGALAEPNLQRFDAMAADLVRSARCRPLGFIWLYPTKAQLAAARAGREWLPERPQVLSVAQKNGLRTIDIARESTWSAALYRADGTHPNVQGNTVLGAILAREIAADESSRRSCPA